MNKIFIEDLIAAKNEKMTCGSEMLEDFISPYTSTIVSKLSDYEITTIKTPKEFGLEINPVYDNYEGIFIGLDTVGKTVKNVNKNYALKPSMGSVSLYGVYKGNNTFDQVIVASDDLVEVKRVFEKISNKDNLDLKTEIYESKELPDDIKILELDDLDIDIKKLKTAYKIISAVEYSSNTTRFDGINYGKSIEEHQDLDELYSKNRGQFIGLDAKKVICLGYYFLDGVNKDQYYNRALNYISKMKADLNGILDENTLVRSNNIDKVIFILSSILGRPTITKKDNATIMGPRFSDMSMLDNIETLEVF